MRTHDGITDFVHGAKVKDEMMLLSDWLVAELTDELQPQIGEIADVYCDVLHEILSDGRRTSPALDNTTQHHLYSLIQHRKLN